MSAIPDPSVTSGRMYPGGTVSFAFTAIEGSTQRWERNRSAMQEAVHTHDALMRAAIVAHGGHVFKTIEDAFCAAFAILEALRIKYRALGNLGGETTSTIILLKSSTSWDARRVQSNCSGKCCRFTPAIDTWCRRIWPAT